MGHICVHARKFQCFCDPQRSFISGKPGTLGDWVENGDHASLGDLPSAPTCHSTVCSWSSVHWVTQALEGREAPPRSLDGGQPLFNEEPLDRARSTHQPFALFPTCSRGSAPKIRCGSAVSSKMAFVVCLVFVC